MGWLVFTLTLLTALANFVDFLFGEESVKPLRDAAFRLYMKIEDNDWRPVYQSPATIVLSYAERMLNLKGGLGAALGRIVLFSILLNLFMSSIIFFAFFLSEVRTVANQMSLLDTYILPEIRLMTWSLPGNLLGDIIAWFSMLFLLRRLKDSNPWTAMFLIASSGALLYAVITLALAARGILFLTAAVYGSAWTIDFWKGAIEVTPLYMKGPIFSRWIALSNVDLLAIIQVALPCLLFIAVSVVGLCVYMSRNVVRRPLILLLTRIEASPKSIFTLAAAVLSAIATAIAAWIKAASS